MGSGAETVLESTLSQTETVHLKKCELNKKNKLKLVALLINIYLLTANEDVYLLHLLMY